MDLTIDDVINLTIDDVVNLTIDDIINLTIDAVFDLTIDDVSPAVCCGPAIETLKEITTESELCLLNSINGNQLEDILIQNDDPAAEDLSRVINILQKNHKKIIIIIIIISYNSVPVKTISTLR